jgi:AraC-like DNA-binding protein
LAKFTIELERALAQRAMDGAPGRNGVRPLAGAKDWEVNDSLCTFGPHDRPFEEVHLQPSINLILAGSFEYRGATGRHLMTPGSVLLGTPGRFFECSHNHHAGDRCISFRYSSEYFEKLTGRSATFDVSRLPPLPVLSPLFVRSCAGLAGDSEWERAWWEGLSVQLAVRALDTAGRLSGKIDDPPPSAAARITRVVHMIERHSGCGLTLEDLAREARLSPYHFLRVFERLTGVTPHQYILRTRLRVAALGLVTEPGKILDVALDSGFGDVSNFNRVFRAEFGVSPRAYRQQLQNRKKSGDRVIW